MQEFEPKRKNKILTKEFLAKNAYIFVLAILLIGGITYGYTFFVQNKKIASGSITTAALTINYTDLSINATGLSVPTDDNEGISEYSKSLTISNPTTIDGKINLTLERTSGLALTDMRYALIINGAIQEIDDVPSDGKILSTAVMGNESVNVELRLWPKTTCSGSETTFVGELTPEIKYLGSKATTSISSPAGKYVNFNCSSTCEVWQIVKVEDNRLVLTRQSDYTNATSRTKSNRYNPTGLFNDDSLITSLSTDEKNVYLAKTVKIDGGSGTQADPYTLVNNDFREEDKKVTAVITYKDSDGTTTLGTQNVYYNETNYIGKSMSNSSFQYWDDGTNHYVLGDTISFTSDINLTAVSLLPSTITISNNSITLTYGTNGENAYTYDGDGALSCTSGDDTKVTCSVDTTNNKIVLVPVSSTTSAITITVSGTNGVNYAAPDNKTFSVNVDRRTVTITAPVARSGTLTYNGNAKNLLSSAGNCSDGGVMYWYSSNPTSNSNSPSFSTSSGWTTTAPTSTSYKGTSAGTYYMWYYCYVDDTENNTGEKINMVQSITKNINKASPNLSLSSSSGNVDIGSSISVSITTSGTGTISCSTEDSNKATCNVNNNILSITGVGVGSTTITVSQAATTNYKSASVSYSVTAVNPITPQYFDFSNNPTTSSYTLYTSVRGYPQQQAGTFGTLYSDGTTRGVCTVYDNTLNCFRPNNVDYEKNHIASAFSTGTCTTYSNYLKCVGGNLQDGMYECRIYDSGKVYCDYYSNACSAVASCESCEITDSTVVCEDDLI